MKKLLCLAVAILLLAACGGKEAALFSKAQRLTDKGEFEKAISVYSQIIRNNPESYTAYASRGLLYERLKAKDAEQLKKNKEMAERDYTRALNLNYQHPEIINNLAALMIDQGRYEEAILQLNLALMLQPDYFMALMNRAIAESQTGRLADALADFDHADAVRPHTSLVFLNRGIAEYESGLYASALQDFATVIELEPNNPRAYMERGRTFIKMGYFQNAMDDLQKSIALKPDYAMPYYYAAELLFNKASTEEAIAYAEQAKAYAPNYAPIYDMLGDMLALSSPVEATQHYLAARRLDPAHATRYQNKIRMMTTENGRKRIVAGRFMHLEDKK